MMRVELCRGGPAKVRRWVGCSLFPWLVINPTTFLSVSTDAIGLPNPSC
jgi:hypothetical protein